MGFFSARRAEDPRQALDEHQSVVRVIRSRFYGKQAGKNRTPSHARTEAASFPASASLSASVSASPASADNQSARSHLPRTVPSIPRQNGASASSKLYSSSTRPERPTHVTATGSNGSHAHAHAPTSAHHAHPASSIRPSPSRPSISSSITTSPRPRPVNSNTMHVSNSRTSTDVITLTLAQRLQELATANADGLLNDDEYRLLRQDLFDRLAGGSAIPQEAPIVPVNNPIADPGPSRHNHSRQTSFYDTQSTRASSTTSKRSLSSAVTGLLKRATSKRRASGPSEFSDTASVFSNSSTAQRSVYQQSISHPRALTKQGSNGSLATDYASSPRLSRVDLPVRRPTRERSQSISRSVRSTKKGAMPPPSSFPSNSAINSAYTQTAPIDGSADDEYLRSTDDIRREIEAVEAEGKRLLDAFNGLELSTLVKKQRDPGMATSASDGRLRAGSGSQYGGGSSRMDVDTQSIRSNFTNRTGHSSAAPGRPSGVGAESHGTNGVNGNGLGSLNGLSHLNRPRRNPSTSNAASLYRKNSISAMSTHSKSSTNPNIPPTPTTPSRLASRLRMGSSSSVNLVRSTSHLPLAPVAERADPPLPNSSLSNPPLTPHTQHRMLRGFASESDAMSEVGDEVNEDMNDIRRRKAEVTARYEARVEYLRARLKGAELREKLLKS